MRFLFFVLLLIGCHRAELVENVPTQNGLGSYRSAGLLFARQDGLNDDTLSDVHDEMKDKIEGTKLFASVVDGGNAELLIRIVLLHGGDEVAIGVELFDTKKSTVIGRFQVKAKPDRKGPSTGGGINLEFDSKQTQAIESAAREVASYLEDHR